MPHSSFCISQQAQAYSFHSCHPPATTTTVATIAATEPGSRSGVDSPHMDGTVWGTGGNRFLVLPGVEVTVPCKSTVPLSTWQVKYGQEEGGSVGSMPEVSELQSMAENVLA